MSTYKIVLLAASVCFILLGALVKITHWSWVGGQILLMLGMIGVVASVVLPNRAGDN